MYHAFVRRKGRQIFAHLSTGDWRSDLPGVADDVHHVFPGDHPLGGERHSRAAMELWFKRLYRLFPQINFEVHRVVATGPPWRTVLTVEWSDAGEAADGEPYVNSGAHVIELRWAKAVYIHGYLDTVPLVESCRRMAAAGIEEAGAPPITG